MPSEPIARRKAYKQNKKQGLCPRCGKKVKKSSKFLHCEVCREYYRNYNEETSEVINEVRRNRYAERKANRQCTRCGEKLNRKSTISICQSCHKKQPWYNAKKR